MVSTEAKWLTHGSREWSYNIDGIREVCVCVCVCVCACVCVCVCVCVCCMLCKNTVQECITYIVPVVVYAEENLVTSQ